mmetsp:Transcript_141732/g.395168  ORF Transcript_141732/g.395168 Transcript_141732/m.395168 type:complete len:286 (-) Transcript_141732:392-1249(-)
MAHVAGHLAQRMHRAEADGDLEDAARVHESPGKTRAARLEGDQGAWPRGLRLMCVQVVLADSVLRAGLRSWPVDAPDLRVVGQELADLPRVLLRALDPKGHRLHTPEHEPSLEGRNRGALRILQEGDARGQLFVPEADQAAHAVGMPGEVLRRAVHHYVRSKVQRAHQERRHRRGVHGQQHAPRLQHLRERPQVAHTHQRIGGRLHVHDARERREALLDGPHVGGVHEAVLHALQGRDLGDQAVHAPVDVAAAQDLLACGAVRHAGHHAEGGHPSAEAEGHRGTF